MLSLEFTRAFIDTVITKHFILIYSKCELYAVVYFDLVSLMNPSSQHILRTAADLEWLLTWNVAENESR